MIQKVSLTEAQQKYVLKHYKVKNVPTMARHLKCSVPKVRQNMDLMGLEQIDPFKKVNLDILDFENGYWNDAIHNVIFAF